MKRNLPVTAAIILASMFFAIPASPAILLDNLQDNTIACDYLIVCPENMVQPAIRLAEYRNSFTGDNVTMAHVVSLEKIMIEFNGSDFKKRHETLWKALKRANDTWATPPKYLVLIGDDAYEIDATDSSAYSIGKMPTWFGGGRVLKNKQSFEVTTSDDFYTSLSSDTPSTYWTNSLSPLYIGRIPASSAAACSLYIEKVKRYELGETDRCWRNDIVAIADDNYQDGSRDPISSSLPFQISCDNTLASNKGFFITKQYIAAFPFDQFNRKPDAKRSIFNILNNGAGFVFFFGHGNTTQLTDEEVLLYSDFDRFENDSMPCVFISMTSTNAGIFLNDGETMSKRFLFRESGGCIAYVASTAMTYAHFNENFATTLFEIINQNPHLPLGRLLFDAKSSLSDPLVSLMRPDNSYYLLGDPALRVFSKRSVPVTLEPIKDSSGISSLRLSVRGSTFWNNTFRYRLEFSYEDTVPPKSPFDTFFVRDSIFSGIIDTMNQNAMLPVAVSPRSLVKATAYVWNDSAEGHALTIINGQGTAATVFNRLTRKKEIPAITIRNAIMTIPPALHGHRGGTLMIFNLHGRMVYSAPLRSGQNDFDLRTGIAAPGRYLVSVEYGSMRTTVPFILISAVKRE